nr:hypothetical protein Iba_chr07aCG1230 [Ipomoea batatas]
MQHSGHREIPGKIRSIGRITAVHLNTFKFSRDRAPVCLPPLHLTDVNSPRYKPSTLCVGHQQPPSLAFSLPLVSHAPRQDLDTLGSHIPHAPFSRSPVSLLRSPAKNRKTKTQQMDTDQPARRACSFTISEILVVSKPTSMTSFGIDSILQGEEIESLIGGGMFPKWIDSHSTFPPLPRFDENTNDSRSFEERKTHSSATKVIEEDMKKDASTTNRHHISTRTDIPMMRRFNLVWRMLCFFGIGDDSTIKTTLKAGKLLLNGKNAAFSCLLHSISMVTIQPKKHYLGIEEKSFSTSQPLMAQDLSEVISSSRLETFKKVMVPRSIWAS